jgi:hypothetical protein
MLLIKCVRYATRKQIGDPMMVGRTLSFHMRCQTFSMLLSATTVYSNKIFLNKLLGGIFHI